MAKSERTTFANEKAEPCYEAIGGESPIRRLTKELAAALRVRLAAGEPSFETMCESGRAHDENGEWAAHLAAAG